MNKFTQTRIKQLEEHSKMAIDVRRFDVAEQCFVEIQQLEQQAQDDKVVDLQTQYKLMTADEQILSDHINNLICYFGSDKVKIVTDLILNEKAS